MVDTIENDRFQCPETQFRALPYVSISDIRKIPTEPDPMRRVGLQMSTAFPKYMVEIKRKT